jgi:3-oxoacyl-[acyl-carrier protein] reductase
MKNLVNLKNKTILVTGASSGIGRETSILLSQLGAKLVLTGRCQSKLDLTFKQLEGTNHRLEAFDFHKCSKIDVWVKNLRDKVDKLDGLVHCAGIQISEPLRLIDEKSLQRIMQINVNAGILLVKALRKNRVLNKNSGLILLSSIKGLIGETGVSVYSASKGAIISLTKSLASELAADMIRVNCIAPATVKTEMIELLFSKMPNEHIKALEKKHLLGFGKPIDVANMIAFLLSDAARWITGSCFIIDGGYSLNR